VYNKLVNTIFSQESAGYISGAVNIQKEFMSKAYKHSGAFGDLIYSLPIAKHFGPGKFYLHLDQINWIGQHYYGSPPNPFHKGRLTQKDFDYMEQFMMAQSYITDFRTMNKSAEITHNLDKFRPLFVGHPGNYVDVYATAFGLVDPELQKTLRNTPWIEADPVVNDGRTVVINRTARWTPRKLSQQWAQWQKEGYESRSIFVGLVEEHEAFQKDTGWTVPWVQTNSMLELAELISGSELFIGNQSQALALAFGLGKTIWCEHRDDLPLERNECYFPDRDNATYF